MTTEEVKAVPFIKWVGGKRSLLAQIRPHLPEKFGRYFEPFLGGGALFFDLRPERATLSDKNDRLVRAYWGVRHHVDEVVRLLSSYRYEREFFEEMRRTDADSLGEAEAAAWFIYLNKTCFNGLYRVNGKGKFNVPFGRYKSPTICDEENLRAAARALSGSEIVCTCTDFEKAAREAERGDLVYFDPPYVPISKSSNFTGYTAGGFTKEDQERLRDVADLLRLRGVHVLISNSNAPLVRELYDERRFTIVPISARRSVNATASGRGAITELLMVSR